MNKIKILLFLFFFASLHVTYSQNVISQYECNIEIKENTDTCSLIFKFENKFNQKNNIKCIIDWSALSIELSKKEDKGLLKKANDLLTLCKKLKHSQFIIINEEGEFRVFSDLKVFEGEQYQINFINALMSKKDTINFNTMFEMEFKYNDININRLKINSYDKYVKIYYVYKPTYTEKKEGFQSVLFISDWLVLQ